MARPRRKTTDAGDKKLSTAAQAKATISGYLSQNPGEHSVVDISDATGLSKSSVGQHLAHMANEQLIPPMRLEGKIKMYHWKGNALVETANRVTATRRTYTKRKVITGAKEVELVVEGTMVIIGRNPESGRFRIILEDIA